MAGSKENGNADVPPSPAFAQTSAFAPALRPDHSTLDLSSTTPKLSPPPTPADGEVPQFSDKYGGYGSQAYGGVQGGAEGDQLLGTGAAAGGASRYRKPGRTSPFQTLLRLLAAMCAVLGLLALLARLSFIPAAPRAKVAHHLSPYMPTTVVAFLRPASGPSAPHPIIPLLVSANDEWSKKLTSQSTTYDRATKTYKAKYGMAPPPGFDKWFAFATQGRNHSLVDEYDQLMEDLRPYRSLSPQELRRRTAELAQVPGISIVSIRNGVAQVHSKSVKWAPALAFQQMLGAFVRDLPDMDIAVNEKPEGRVLPRKQKKVYVSDYGLDGTEELAVNMSDPMLSPSLKGFIPEWKRDGSVWEAYRRSCPAESAARRLVESIRSAETNGALQVQGRSSSKPESPQTRRKQATQAWPATREMAFSHDLDASFDVCDYPSLHTLHSAFYSDQRNIEHLYPVFSPSKPSGYADILIPSHHYWSPSSEFTYEWEMQRGRTKTPTDLEWQIKKPTAYWRGKVTRGADTPPGHGASFQKQRLVKMANQASTESKRVLVSFDKETAGLSSIAAPVAVVNKATSDIAMACDPSLGECSYLRSLGYRVEPPAPLSDAWKHKFVLDIDEIGFSPRFLALMESKSAVVKSSIQREFWRGWIQPWKHFIPLSSSYSELHNIQTFFSGFPPSLSGTRGNRTVASTTLTRPHPIPELPLNADGSAFDNDKALRDIAEAGREWKTQHLRKADMECYVYRLMVEWANLVTVYDDEPEEVAA
ncbi:SPOSA6832_01224 [Sporobolomyces salmonicolor]|uniref:SPOSA6832_01224-mRNA-1:cds n=1 Tax=Sporidiobolus salmonicolor TaxID=5005 RepID=A0A0D6EJA4_SPOSA|nr:SPOSA6832_01224 [Sporobolomyces salmonicolor]